MKRKHIELAAHAASISMALLVLMNDLRLPLGIAAGSAYFMVILISLWVSKLRYIYVYAGVCSVFIYIGYKFSPPGGLMDMVITNRFLSLFAVWATAYLGFYFKRNEMALQKAHTDLNIRMDEVLLYKQKLEQSNQDLTDFAYIASHDLKEPMRVIAGYCHLLKEKYMNALDAESDEYFKSMENTVIRMQALIEDLLKFSQVTTLADGASLVNLNSVCELTVKNLRILIAEKEGVVLWSDLPTVKGNETLMIQLMQNLIVNALKYCAKDSPRITISSLNDNGRWVIAIKDNGIGIDAQNHEKIFHMFQRLHLFSEIPGTGAGLAICRRIVQYHGGKIWVESKKGEGSIFYFTIPQ